MLPLYSLLKRKREKKPLLYACRRLPEPPPEPCQLFSLLRFNPMKKWTRMNMICKRTETVL